MRRMQLRRIAPAVLLLSALATPALAHHDMDGKLPATFMEGLISGLLHPVIGLDHLLAIVAIGVLSTRLASGAWFALTFVAASMLGTGLHLASLDLAASEVLVAATVVVFGAVLLSSSFARALDSVVRWAPLAVLGGALHGYAYGEAIVGSTPGPLAAYLFGFSIVQMAVVLAVGRLARWASEKGVAAVRVHVVSGALVSLAGVVLTVVALQAL
jgi:urease accessory protein